MFWTMFFPPGTPYPEPESRDLAGDLLALEAAEAIRLTPWQLAALKRIRCPGNRISERDRMAVRRILSGVDWRAWFSLPIPTEPPEVLAERAARDALGLLRPKPKQRKKGEKKAPKEKAPGIKGEAELECPVCNTGALLKCWHNRGGRVSFFCQNRRCVKKYKISC